MNKNIVLCGVGGQGTVLASKLIAAAAMHKNIPVMSAETIGMAQRGGSVSTQVHWGEKVYSPVIGKGAADIMVAFEKMEAVRYADFLKPAGVAIVNDYAIASSTTAAGLCQYPEGCLEAMQSHFTCYSLNAGEISIGLGNAKCMNVVLFGAMCDMLGVPEVDWESIVAETVPQKVRALNLEAFRAGREAVRK